MAAWANRSRIVTCTSRAQDLSGEDSMTRVPRETIINFVQGRCTPEEGLRILEQIEASPESSRDLDLFADIVGVFHENPGINTQDPPRPSEGGLSGGLRLVKRTRGRRLLAYGAPMAALIVFAAGLSIFGGLPGTSHVRTTLLDVDLSMVEWATRGTTGNDVDAAREEAFRGNFSGAREHIQRFINAAPSREERAFGMIAAGTLCLLEAKDTERWWRQEPDPTLVRQGVEYLQAVVGMPVRPVVRDEARLLLARGLFWLGRRDDAVAQVDSASLGDYGLARRAVQLKRLMMSQNR
jgi:hypothetical protein